MAAIEGIPSVIPSPQDMRKSVYDINLDAVEFLATEQLKAMQAQRESGGIH